MRAGTRPLPEPFAMRAHTAGSLLSQSTGVFAPGIAFAKLPFARSYTFSEIYRGPFASLLQWLEKVMVQRAPDPAMED